MSKGTTNLQPWIEYFNMLQRYVEQGLFFITEGTHSENGVMKTHLTTKVTPKGQQYFINKFIH